MRNTLVGDLPYGEVALATAVEAIQQRRAAAHHRVRRSHKLPGTDLAIFQEF